jgi:hypothetical protein
MLALLEAVLFGGYIDISIAEVMWNDTHVRLLVQQFLFLFIRPLPLSFTRTCLQFCTIYSWPIVTESIYLTYPPDKRRVIIFFYKYTTAYLGQGVV